MLKDNRVGGDRHKVRSLAMFNLDDQVFVSRTEYIAEPQLARWNKKMLVKARAASKGNIKELFDTLNQVQKAALTKYLLENGITVNFK